MSYVLKIGALVVNSQKNSSAPASLNKKYRPEIDGLRCLAVCAVIFYHAGFGLFSGGYVGVDVFFVISGYLITSIIYIEVVTGSFSFVSFYERRVRRIFPVLFFVIACSAVPAVLWLSPDALKNFGQSVAAVTLFVSNFYFWRKSGYFNNNTEELPLLHTWSLSVEEQFYIFFPVLLLLLWRVCSGWIGRILIFTTSASLGACLLLERSGSTTNFFWPHTRAWELLLGSIISIYQIRFLDKFKPFPWILELLSIVGLLMVIGSILLLDKMSSFPGINTIYPVFGTALIIAFAHGNTLVGRLFSLKPIVGIGLISYSAYLWHQPIFAFARVLNESGVSAINYITLIVLTGGLSYLTWRFIENPFRNKQQFSRRFIFASSLGVMSLFLVVGVLAHVSKGLPQRFPQRHLDLAATADSSPFRNTCHTEGINYRPPQEACVYFKGDVSWATLGDSHAVELTYALAEQLQKRDIALRHLSFSGCPPALSFDVVNPGCSQWTKESMEYLLKQHSIKHVVLIYRHSFYLHGDQLSTYPALPHQLPIQMSKYNPEVARTRYKQSFALMVKQLVDAGKSVYIMNPVPELPHLVDRNIFKISFDLQTTVDPFGTLLDYYYRRQEEALEMTSGFKKDYLVTLINPAQTLCDTLHCYAVSGNSVLYYDNNHVSLTGARLVIEHFLAENNLVHDVKATHKSQE